MSASTVSVTANPRRRTTSSTINDVKQSIDIINDGNTTTGDDKVTAGHATNKDLSHSIRGEEPLLERSSKETTTQPKKQPSSQLPNSVRNRKKTGVTSSKYAKPRWKTLASILFKNVLLLLVLVGLVQMVRRLVVKNVGISEEGSLLGFTDMEGRIASVETSMKTTAKMLQVQVEVLDKKIESQVGNLRREVSKKIEDKGVEIQRRFKEFEVKSEGLEAGLSELKAKTEGFLTKDDLEKLYDEVKNGKGFGKELSLEEIRGLAREIVEKEIDKHAADGLGRVDYALASSGARVVKHSEPLVVGKVGSWFVGSKDGVNVEADKMLLPSFGEPGRCFALKGSSGFAQIRLRTAIVPEAITLEHVAKSVAYDRSSAPKYCRVFGWLQGQQAFDTELTVDSEKMHLLTEFTYDLEKSNAQTFDVLDSARSAVIDTVRFEFSSNHGSPTFTCIYRLRVHGHEQPNQVPVIAAADS